MESMNQHIYRRHFVCASGRVAQGGRAGNPLCVRGGGQHRRAVPRRAVLVCRAGREHLMHVSDGGAACRLGTPVLHDAKRPLFVPRYETRAAYRFRHAPGHGRNPFCRPARKQNGISWEAFLLPVRFHSGMICQKGRVPEGVYAQKSMYITEHPTHPSQRERRS